MLMYPNLHVLYCYAVGSFEENTELPEGLKNWNKEMEKKESEEG